MAIAKRCGSYHLRIRPFEGNGVIGVGTPAKTKQEAKQIEMAILTACRLSDYRALDPVSREVCIRLFRNQGWDMPASLDPSAQTHQRTDELTLWQAAELFYKYPEIAVSKIKWRYEYAMLNLAEKLGRDRPIKSIWVPNLKAYQVERLNDKAAPSTVNWEMATLSRIFGVLIDLQIVESNPVRLVKRLSAKSGERQVYLSLKDTRTIAGKCPDWFTRMILTAYYTGMRRGEILGLTRKQVNLAKRMIVLSPVDTKEAHWKRIPIHNELVPVIQEALKVTCFGTDKVFVLQDGQGVRSLEIETFKNPWPRACEVLKKAELLKEPFPRFHDLRHTWKTNARRSGMDPEIRESILGHWYKAKSVNDRYGRISDQELVAAIDKMTFDHGDTEILVAK